MYPAVAVKMVSELLANVMEFNLAIGRVISGLVKNVGRDMSTSSAKLYGTNQLLKLLTIPLFSECDIVLVTTAVIV